MQLRTVRTPAGRSRLLRAVGVAVALLGAAHAWSAGPPPAAFPERFASPATDVERNKRCMRYGERVQDTRRDMANGGVLSRLGWLRERHRKMERFLKEYCGYADADDFEPSHRSVASMRRPPVSQPAVTGWDHPVHWYAGGHGDTHDGEHH